MKNEEVSCYKQMVTDHSPYIPKGNPFFLLSLTPNTYIYLLSNASVLLCWSSCSSSHCADHSIMGLFSPPGSVWMEGPGCFASSSHWASNISFSFLSLWCWSCDAIFHLYPPLNSPNKLLSARCLSKIQQDFTSPSTRMYPGAFLFSVSQMLPSRPELVSHVSDVNWDWKGFVSLSCLSWAWVVVF